MTPWTVHPLVALILLTSSLSTNAAVVSTCDEAGLRAALATGEPVTFGCDVLSNSIGSGRARWLSPGHRPGFNDDKTS